MRASCTDANVAPFGIPSAADRAVKYRLSGGVSVVDGH